MIKEALKSLSEKKDLSAQLMQQVITQIVGGSCQVDDIAAFLSLLAQKGETAAELAAAVKVLRQHSEPIKTDLPRILDTCGTGGDGSGTFNISTVSAFVAAGAGVAVAKHGNRSVSSRCGSADVLEALGVNLSMERARLGACLQEIGIVFLFAPNLHPAMKHVMPARKKLGTKTMFNIIGPLINPARATHQLIGVYAARWVPVLAEVLANLGSKHVLVVSSSDGFDEVSLTAETLAAEAGPGGLRQYRIDPAALGFAAARRQDLVCSSVEECVEAVREVLSGVPGARRDIVLLNAGCALYAADEAGSIAEGIRRAAESIDSGKAREKLEQLKEYSRS